MAAGVDWSQVAARSTILGEAMLLKKRTSARWLIALMSLVLIASSCTDSARTDTAESSDTETTTTDSSSSDDTSSSSDAAEPADEVAAEESTDAVVELTQGETFEFTVQTGVPATSVYHDLIVTWGERIDVMSSGRLKADVVPSGAIVGALEILDAVDDGTMEAGFAWSNYWNGKNKAAALFSNPPAGSTGMDQSTSLAWMYDGGGLELYQRLYQEEIGVNVIPLPVAPMGPDPFGWFSEVITSVDDVQGLSFRSPPGLPGDSFTRLGMDAIAMPGSEIIPAANAGTIEGAEWISPSDDTALGFQDVWSDYYLQGIHQSTDIGEMLLNADWFNSLPADLQMIIRVAAQATIVDSQNLSITQNARAVSDLQAQGINIWNTPDEFYPAFIDAWNEVAAELEAEDPFFAEVRASQKAYAEEVMPYRLTITELYQTIGETYHELVGEDPS